MEFLSFFLSYCCVSLLEFELNIEEDKTRTAYKLSLFSLAQLHVVVDLPALHGGAHYRRLSYPALHLPLGGQVDDDREVDDGDGRQDGEGLAETKSPTDGPVALSLLLCVSVGADHVQSLVDVTNLPADKASFIWLRLDTVKSVGQKKV